MLTDGFAIGQSSPPSSSVALRDGSAARSIIFERRWRQVDENVDLTTDGVAITRWADDRDIPRSVEATIPASKLIISIALASTRLSLTRDRVTLFDGDLPAGALHISATPSRLHADFQAPYDFLHFHVPVQTPSMQDLVRTLQAGSDRGELILLRDPFAEQLGKALADPSYSSDLDFAQCVSRTLVVHITRLNRPQAKVAALPRWRLRRIEEYVQENIGNSISLAELAAVAGLSRMHFAAQFRAATGYRPHEFVLLQRIEKAKREMDSSDASLVDIAISAGFRTQAHFSTVFKRLMAETPARWRDSQRQNAVAKADAPGF